MQFLFFVIRIFSQFVNSCLFAACFKRTGCRPRVTCSPRDPRFAGSNPAEVDGFFSGRKNSEHKSFRMDFKLRVPSLRFQVC